MKNVTKLIFSLICISLILLLTVSVFAEAPRLIDDADLLSDSEEARLAEKLDHLRETYGQDIVIITVDDMITNNAWTYARSLFLNNGYGIGSSQSGILLMVSMAQRDYAIYTHGEAEDIFSESDLDSLEDAFVYLLSDGDYCEALDSFADKCEYIIKYDKRLAPIWIIISLAVGALVAFLTVRSMVSKHKSVKSQRDADTYMRRDTFKLNRSRDIFLYSHVTRRLKPKNNSSSGGRSSSGRSGGGRSGKF